MLSFHVKRSDMRCRPKNDERTCTIRETPTWLSPCNTWLFNAGNVSRVGLVLFARLHLKKRRTVNVVEFNTVQCIGIIRHINRNTNSAQLMGAISKILKVLPTVSHPR
jgi:hypothetical protein